MRGASNCPRLCPACKIDCTCEECGYCHGCRGSFAFSDYIHTNIHSCQGPSFDLCKQVQSPYKEKFLSPILRVHLTADSQTYYVHQDTLKKESEYFKALLNVDLRESQEGLVELDEEVDKADAFEKFLEYAYTGSYSHTATLQDLLLHARVYTFAERIQAAALKDASLSKAKALFAALYATSKSSDYRFISGIVPQTIATIYDHTFDDSADDLIRSLIGSSDIIQESSNPAENLNAAAEEPRNEGEREATDSGSQASSRSYSVEKKNKKGKRMTYYSTKSYGQTDQDSITAEVLATRAIKDGFRKLLAKFCAACLVKLAQDRTFLACHLHYEEFAADMLLYLKQSDSFTSD